MKKATARVDCCQHFLDEYLRTTVRTFGRLTTVTRLTDPPDDESVECFSLVMSRVP